MFKRKCLTAFLLLSYVVLKECAPKLRIAIDLTKTSLSMHFNSYMFLCSGGMERWNKGLIKQKDIELNRTMGCLQHCQMSTDSITRACCISKQNNTNRKYHKRKNPETCQQEKGSTIVFGRDNSNHFLFDLTVFVAFTVCLVNVVIVFISVCLVIALFLY